MRNFSPVIARPRQWPKQYSRQNPFLETASSLRSSQRRNLFLFLLIPLLLCSCTERRQMGLVNDADEKIAQNHFGEGVELLRKAIAVNPESKVAIKALYKLGFSLESYLRDYDGAIFNYQEFIRLSQDPVSIYEVQKRIANIYFEQYRDPEKAITAYKKILKLNPDSLEADLFQFRIAESYYRENNFEQARHEYQELLERFPKSQFNARARFEIGNCYYMDGKYDIAIEALKQVLRHHSQSEYATEAQFLMAECMEHQDKLQNALQMYENIQGRYPAADVLNMRISALRKRLSQKR